jgi:hypothetical protein
VAVVVAMEAAAETLVTSVEILVAVAAVAALLQLNDRGNCCSYHCCQVFAAATQLFVGGFVNW